MIFEQEKLLGTKIKSNVRINPIKDLKSMHYPIDFVYKNGVINLIQTVQNQTETLNNWFSRIDTFSNNYDHNASIYLVYEESVLEKEDNTVFDMFKYLQGNDERIKPVEFGSQDLIQLTRDIQKEGKHIKYFEAELA